MYGMSGHGVGSGICTRRCAGVLNAYSTLPNDARKLVFTREGEGYDCVSARKLIFLD